jgi:hypothetical protein
MTSESWDKLKSTLRPRLLKLTLESEISEENSLVCIYKLRCPSIYSVEVLKRTPVKRLWQLRESYAARPHPGRPAWDGGRMAPPFSWMVLIRSWWWRRLRLSEAEQLEAGLPHPGWSAWLWHVSSLHCTDLMINTCMSSREAVLRWLPESCM